MTAFKRLAATVLFIFTVARFSFGNLDTGTTEDLTKNDISNIKWHVVCNYKATKIGSGWNHIKGHTQISSRLLKRSVAPGVTSNEKELAFAHLIILTPYEHGQGN